MLNATQIQQLTPEQFILEAHQITAIPALIIMFIVYSFIMLGVGLIMSNNKQKILKIWVISLIFGIIMLLGFIYMPLFTQSLVNII